MELGVTHCSLRVRTCALEDLMLWFLVSGNGKAFPPFIITSYVDRLSAWQSKTAIGTEHRIKLNLIHLGGKLHMPGLFLSRLHFMENEIIEWAGRMD